MSHPTSAEFRQQNIDEDPFRGMHLTSSEFLTEVHGRYLCAKCQKSRKYFCYSCYMPLPSIQDRLPRVELPIQIDIIKHHQEIDGKSTAAHAALLAPGQVTVYTYPDIPIYDGEDTVLIFPTFTAVEIGQLFSNDLRQVFNTQTEVGHRRSTLMKKIPENVLSTAPLAANDGAVEARLPVKRAVFIDSTWKQCKGIYRNENIRKLQCVVLQNRISQFWRHQKGSPRWYLATIEAIHQFLLELHLNAWGVHPNYTALNTCFHDTVKLPYEVRSNVTAYNGQYDNLLFFFRHMYDVIHDYYDHDNLHAYKRRLT